VTRSGAVHPAFLGARQRGRCAAVCPSRANAQDGKDVTAEHRRRGHAHALRPRYQHSHRQRGRDRGFCRQQSKLRRLGAERILHDRSADQRPIVRHYAKPASPGEWWRDRLDHVVRRASSTAAATSTSALFGIYRWGWGFSTSQDFNGDIALIACFAASWTPAMVRRWHADPSGFLRP
jgi:hypothetical protein